jgi:hypothetical protein
VNGIFLRIPGLCLTENLPKLPSFSVNPSDDRLFSRVDSSAVTTASTTTSASFLVVSANACWTRETKLKVSWKLILNSAIGMLTNSRLGFRNLLLHHFDPHAVRQFSRHQKTLSINAIVGWQFSVCVLFE